MNLHINLMMTIETILVVALNFTVVVFPQPPGGSEYRLSPREAVDTLTVRYPSVDVCTTSVSLGGVGCTLPRWKYQLTATY